ncbi:MAG: class I SAM-dependent methyltransferase [Planctomycetota bacterium]
MSRLDYILRRIVPSVPVLSRNRLLMAPLDLADRLISLPFGDARKLPPNRLRIRVGAGNRILFNQLQHRLRPVNFWLYAFASGLVRLDSRILDVGCGCGRFAATLRDFGLAGKRFTGRYTGIDVDREMIEWCRAHFPANRFAFQLADVSNAVYNPGGSRDEVPAFDLADDSQDFVFAMSLLTHLLEEDLQRCLQETWRVLGPGATMHMTVFCMDHLEPKRGGRWTFRHRRGEACLEDPRYPEAAVAYSKAFLESACAQAGFSEIELCYVGGQSLLRARKERG